MDRRYGKNMCTGAMHHKGQTQTILSICIVYFYDKTVMYFPGF